MAAVIGSLGDTRARGGARNSYRGTSRATLRTPPGSWSGRPGSVGHRARWRQSVGILASFLALAGVWVGAAAIRSTENGAAAQHDVVYVAHPGDTLWGIATRLDPAGDPEQVVALLGAELHGAPLRPGTVLTVP